MLDLAEIPCVKRTITLCEVANELWRLQLAIEVEAGSEPDDQIWARGFGKDRELSFAGIPLRLGSAGRCVGGPGLSTYYLEGEIPPGHDGHSRYDFLWKRPDVRFAGGANAIRLNAEQDRRLGDCRRQLREELMELGKEVGNPAWLEDSLKALMGVPVPKTAEPDYADPGYTDLAMVKQRLRLTGPRPHPMLSNNRFAVGMPQLQPNQIKPIEETGKVGDLAVAMLDEWNAEMGLHRTRPSWWDADKEPAVAGEADHVAPVAMTKTRAADDFDVIRNRKIELQAIKQGKDFLVYRDYAEIQTIFMKPLSDRADRAMNFCPEARLLSDPAWYHFRSFPTGADPSMTEHEVVEFGPTL